MYTDKDSNLISDLKTKYGEESVRSIRKWEITIKKMADYRNHRRFMLRCIKASLTPVSCKLKNPLKTKKSYNIIHKESLDKQRETQYRKFKDMLFNSNQHVQDPDLDLQRSRSFINKIKDHRHSKIKEKHIDKFKRLYFKHHGYHHNLNRHAVNLDNINHQNPLSGHRNVPTSFSSTSTPASNPTTVPATPMAPTPSNSTMDSNPAPRLPPYSHNHTCMDCTNKWVIILSKTPFTKEQLYLLQKGPNFAITPKYPP